MLRLPFRLLLGFALPVLSASVGSAATLTADVVFANDTNQPQTPMTIAFDGTHYWSVSGGSSLGVRETEYDSAGNVIASLSPNLDFRSIFTDAAGNVYARAYADSTIYKQTSAGVFTPYVTLTGGALDYQSAVVLNGAGTEYIAFNGGALSRWDLSGNALAPVTFTNYGTMGTESGYPQSRGVAAVGNTYLTYSDGVMSVWSLSGVRIDTLTLASAGQSFDSYFSFSYANNRAWVVDSLLGDWRGYPYQPSAVPEPSGLALASIGGLAALLASRRRRGAVG